MANNCRCSITVALIFFSCTAFGANGSQFTSAKYLGEFSEVARSAVSGDCSGFHVQLWKVGEHREIIGTISRDDGPCGKPGSPIYDVSVGEPTSSISFMAPGPDPRHDELFEFNGHLTSAELRGKIRITTVRPKQERSTSEIDLIMPRVEPK
jgi:hypothetical protein